MNEENVREIEAMHRKRSTKNELEYCETVGRGGARMVSIFEMDRFFEDVKFADLHLERYTITNLANREMLSLKVNQANAFLA